MQRKGGLYCFLAYFLQFPPLKNTNDTEKYIVIRQRWLSLSRLKILPQHLLDCLSIVRLLQLISFLGVMSQLAHKPNTFV